MHVASNGIASGLPASACQHISLPGNSKLLSYAIGGPNAPDFFFSLSVPLRHDDAGLSIVPK